MSNDDDFGPKWCMNTQEVSSGFILLIVLFLAGFILFPAFILGMYLGANVWNVKIIKYTFGGVIASGYGYGLCKLNDYCDPSLNRIVMVTIIALSWLMLDYISAHSVNFTRSFQPFHKHVSTFLTVNQAVKL